MEHKMREIETGNAAGCGWTWTACTRPVAYTRSPGHLAATRVTASRECDQVSWKTDCTLAALCTRGEADCFSFFSGRLTRQRGPMGISRRISCASLRILAWLSFVQNCWTFHVPVGRHHACHKLMRRGNPSTQQPVRRVRHASASRGACMLWADDRGPEDLGVAGTNEVGCDQPSQQAPRWTDEEKLRVHKYLYDNRPPGIPYSPPILPSLGSVDKPQSSGGRSAQARATQDEPAKSGSGLLSALQGAESENQNLPGRGGSGLLGALQGTVNDNLLSQILHSTAKDKRAVGEVEQLLRVVNALTSSPTDGGCPWTAEQDAMGIIQHCKGELDEIAEEIVLGDDAEQQALESELGDLLFNTILLIKLCERDGLGGASLEGAAASASSKLRRRAPFLFGEGKHPQTPAEANAIWKAVKKKEKAGLIDTLPAPLNIGSSPQYLGGLTEFDIGHADAHGQESRPPVPPPPPAKEAGGSAIVEDGFVKELGEERDASA